MYQISKRLTITGAFLSLACGFLLTQQPTKATTTSQAATPTTQVVKADSNVLDQGVDGTCKWDLVKDGNERVLTIHAGQLDPGYINSKIEYPLSNEITKIVIDPDVIASQDSSGLFNNFQNVKKFVGLSNLDTSQVTNMSDMFGGCGVKELDLSGWDTSHVTNMRYMFTQCLNLEKINVKNWDTSNVEDMSGMFFTCPKLHKLDLSNFETTNLKISYLMFGEDAIYDLDIRNFDSSHASSDDLFEICQIYKITVGPKFTDTFPTFYNINNFPFEEDGIMYITTSNKWVALDGPDKGSKKDPYEMKDVTRTQPVTYEVEHMPLENKSYTEYKTITRTINLHLRSAQGWPDTINTSIKQKATIHRQVTTDENGQKTYGEWSQDYWEEYNAPNSSISSPDPAKVSKQIVDGNTQDQTVDIYY